MSKCLSLHQSDFKFVRFSFSLTYSTVWFPKQWGSQCPNNYVPYFVNSTLQAWVPYNFMFSEYDILWKSNFHRGNNLQQVQTSKVKTPCKYCWWFKIVIWKLILYILLNPHNHLPALCIKALRSRNLFFRIAVLPNVVSHTDYCRCDNIRSCYQTYMSSVAVWYNYGSVIVHFSKFFEHLHHCNMTALHQKCVLILGFFAKSAVLLNTKHCFFISTV